MLSVLCVCFFTFTMFIYFQVVLAIGYRTYETINVALKRPTKLCWTVNRGEGLSPVQSCEGLLFFKASFTMIYLLADTEGGDTERLVAFFTVESQQHCYLCPLNPMQLVTNATSKIDWIPVNSVHIFNLHIHHKIIQLLYYSY